MAFAVDLDRTGDGAVLAADVLDARRNVLLSAGTQLTKAHIALLRRRGIRTVTVVAVSEAPAGSAGERAGGADRLAALLARQAEVFSQVLDRPLMAVIFAAASAHLRAGNLPPG